MYTFYTSKPLTVKQEKRIRLFVTPMFVWSTVYVCVNIHIHIYIQCRTSMGLLGMHAIGHHSTDCICVVVEPELAIQP